MPGERTVLEDGMRPTDPVNSPSTAAAAPADDINAWTDKVDATLFDWYDRARIAQHAHQLASNRCYRNHFYLGIPALILSTVVGTAVFASLEKTVYLWAQILIGLISLASAALTALQTFLKSAERAERHRVAAARYSALKVHIQMFLALKPSLRGDPGKVLEDLRKTKEQLGQEGPNLPDDILRKAREEKQKQNVWQDGRGRSLTTSPMHGGPGT